MPLVLFLFVYFVFIFSSTNAAITSYIFNQTLDHFNSNDGRTFPQRYFIQNDFWDPSKGAPVLLFLGLAAPFPAINMTNYGVYGQALQDYQALGVGIENRFYGMSLNEDMLTRGNLKYLTFEQSLEDTIAIQDFIKQNSSIKSLNWMVFGASYSGLKSSIHRQKFPDRFNAAFASSAPVNFQYNLSMYFGHPGDIIKNEATGGSQIQEKSNFPTKILSSRFSIGSFLSGTVAGQNQFSFTNVYTNPKTSICRPFTTLSRTPYETLQIIIADQMSTNSCIDASYQGMLDPINKWGNGINNWTAYGSDSGGRAWAYEICANIGFNAFCDPDSGCPFSKYASEIGQIAMCTDAFNITENMMQSNSQNFLKTYGGNQPNTKRLLMTNGYMDCGYPYGLLTKDESKEIYTVINPLTGHVSDIYPKEIYQPIATENMWVQIKTHLDKWVDEATIKPQSSSATSTCKNFSLIMLIFMLIF